MNEVSNIDFMPRENRSIKDNSLTNNLEFALLYARNGIPVFPLHTPTPNGPTDCSCLRKDCRLPQDPNGGSNVGKHPRTPNGFKDATKDEEQIRQWWSRWPDANIGGITGKESGFNVFDIDPKNGGMDSLPELEKRIDVELSKPVGGSNMPTVRTGRHPAGRGCHVFCKYAPGLKENGSIEGYPGIDIKTDGGYVVLPP